ncbi:MAG TPA: hypothetical protein VF541_22825 [Longimicrobium sp.]
MQAASGPVSHSHEQTIWSQSSHNTGDDREPTLAPRWKYIPTELLREFRIDLVARRKLRGVARMVGLAKDTVRKFVNGISQPTFSTRRKLGELFLEFYPGWNHDEALGGGGEEVEAAPAADRTAAGR